MAPDIRMGSKRSNIRVKKSEIFTKKDVHRDGNSMQNTILAAYHENLRDVNYAKDETYEESAEEYQGRRGGKSKMAPNMKNKFQLTTNTTGRTENNSRGTTYEGKRKNEEFMIVLRRNDDKKIII